MFLGADPVTMILSNFCNAFQNVRRLRDIQGQRFAVLAPKFPCLLTYDLNDDMIRLRLSREQFRLLTLYQIFERYKDMFKRLLTLFYP